MNKVGRPRINDDYLKNHIGRVRLDDDEREKLRSYKEDHNLRYESDVLRTALHQLFEREGY